MRLFSRALVFRVVFFMFVQIVASFLLFKSLWKNSVVHLFGFHIMEGKAFHDMFWCDHFVCMQLLAGLLALYPRKMRAELHRIVSLVQDLDSHRAFFSFFVHEGCLYACFFYLAYRTFHGKRKNSVLYVVNIIRDPAKCFDRVIMDVYF